MKIQKQVTLHKSDYNTLHLEIINPFLPVRLTPKEIEVLSGFMSLEGELAKDKFGTTARRVVKEKLGISSGGLGNYLKSLKEKGFIYKKHGALFIEDIVKPDPQQTEYTFKLKSETLMYA